MCSPLVTIVSFEEKSLQLEMKMNISSGLGTVGGVQILSLNASIIVEIDTILVVCII